MVYDQLQLSRGSENFSESRPSANMRDAKCRGHAGFILSADAKPRLKWTSELHQRFVEAVTHLGGPEKATPKSLMRVMRVPGLTICHLKSYLQKYRLGKSSCLENRTSENKGYRLNQIGDNIGHVNVFPHLVEANTQCQLHETSVRNFPINGALRMQLEVQQKLHEEIEVQKHLQLRIEAQGKYLQAALQKAHDAFSSQNLASLGYENTCSETLKLGMKLHITDHSIGSCITSLDRSERNDQGLNIQINALGMESPKLESVHQWRVNQRDQEDYSLLCSSSQQEWCPLLAVNGSMSFMRMGREKRSCSSTLSDASNNQIDGTSVEQPVSKKHFAIERKAATLKKFSGCSEAQEALDLNAKTKEIDLNGFC